MTAAAAAARAGWRWSRPAGRAAAGGAGHYSSDSRRPAESVSLLSRYAAHGPLRSALSARRPLVAARSPLTSPLPQPPWVTTGSAPAGSAAAKVCRQRVGSDNVVGRRRRRCWRRHRASESARLVCRIVGGDVSVGLGVRRLEVKQSRKLVCA